MADDNARAVARQHTAQLLKMLRGYGPTEQPVPALKPAAGREAEREPDRPAAGVSEANAGYAGRSTAARGSRVSERRQAGAEIHPPAPLSAEVDGPRPPDEAVAARSAATAPEARKPFAFASIATVGETLSRQRGALGELIAKAKALSRQRQMFQAYLPPHLQEHAELIRLDEESWVVHTGSASWATRLRYALHNIREPLGQQLGLALPKPHIRVVPAAAPPPPRPRLKLTKRTAKLLEATARDLADERLSAALRRLAAHARPPAEALDASRR
ncbi:MAG: DUF721 domain-containing protein [Candidatus Competibacteraceae bacterium]|nr:DUF721 domain-containing protein [Candidatus Competibacteraceae bacterium]